MVRAQSSGVTGIPAMVLESHDAGQTVGSCGMSEIKRVWATEDSRRYCGAMIAGVPSDFCQTCIMECYGFRV